MRLLVAGFIRPELQLNLHDESDPLEVLKATAEQVKTYIFYFHVFICAPVSISQFLLFVPAALTPMAVSVPMNLLLIDAIVVA